ncbi:phage tail assembly chaperone [Stutzerimonas xanthomarina]|uniref:phage tail assembly chaperone n=1 Tax=Stutzerimonas xanthomarina TaxID=271420 RepID=UPI003AA7FF29
MTTKKAAIDKPFNLADFFTVPVAQAGKPLPLKKPDGTETEYHLMVLGVDAPAARQALLAVQRLFRDERNDKMTDDEKQAIAERASLQYRTALVAGWNLPIEFNKEAVGDLLTNNPGLSLEIEQFSGDRTRFFASTLAA